MLQPTTSSRKKSVVHLRNLKGTFKKRSPVLVTSTEAQTAVSRSQARITCDRIVATDLIRVHRGLDFLKVSYWVTWDDSEFLNLLEWLKKRLQETDDEQSCVFKNCGLDWNLQRTGTSKFNYRLKAGDVTLLLSHRQGKADIPNVRLEIGSLSSQTTASLIIEDIKHWLERNHANFTKEQVSEVHLAADFIGIDLRTLDIGNQERWIHRPHSFNPYYEHKKLTGVSIGKGDFMLRIYDKVTELKRAEHKQEVFADLWKVETYDQFPVTRVEYQLRRPILREFQHLEFCNGIDTIKQLLFSLKALWSYCTTDWSRFMGTIVDRDNKHQSRALYSNFWNIVRSIVWTGIDELRREKPTKHKDIEALRKQARGIAMSVAAFFVSDPDDIERIVLKSRDFIEEDLRELFKDETKFMRKMQKKRNELFIDTVPF